MRNSICYLNWRGPQGRETVDELDRSEFKNALDFRLELSRLCREYRLAGMNVYASQRACKA